MKKNENQLPSSNTEEKLSEISQTVEAINIKVDDLAKKARKKWDLPVFIVVLTAVLGILNYLIEKNVDKSLNNELKKQEIYAEFVAESKRDFYKEAKIRLLELDSNYEKFCMFLDKDSENKLDTTLQKFMHFYEKQMMIEEEIVSSMSQYSEYISESAFNLMNSQRDSVNSDSILFISKGYLKNALESVRNGLTDLEK